MFGVVLSLILRLTCTYCAVCIIMELYLGITEASLYDWSCVNTISCYYG